MKKSIIYSILLTVGLIACEPSEDRTSMGGAITADQLEVTATVVEVNGVKTNKIILENKSPVLSNWTFNTGSSTRSYDEINVSTIGETTISFKGLNADGTQITKDLTVTVDKIVYQPSRTSEFTVTSAWVFDEYNTVDFSVDTIPYGTGQQGDISPSIDGLDIKAGFNESKASMRFSFDETAGMVFTKTLENGTTQTGSFYFDMTATDGWSQGTLYLSGTSIPNPYEFGGNTVLYEFDIVNIDEDELVLSSKDLNGDGLVTIWIFRPYDFVSRDNSEQLAILNDGSSRTWTWDDTRSGADTEDGTPLVHGNGALFVDNSPSWWQLGLGKITSNEGKDAKMIFHDDLTLEIKYNDNTVETGTYGVNMNKAYKTSDGTRWADGRLSTKDVTILNGQIDGTRIYSTCFLSLKEDKMTLVYTESSESWGECFYWFFRAE